MKYSLLYEPHCALNANYRHNMFVSVDNLLLFTIGCENYCALYYICEIFAMHTRGPCIIIIHVGKCYRLILNTWLRN